MRLQEAIDDAKQRAGRTSFDWHVVKLGQGDDSYEAVSEHWLQGNPYHKPVKTMKSDVLKDPRRKNMHSAKEAIKELRDTAKQAFRKDGKQKADFR